MYKLVGKSRVDQWTEGINTDKISSLEIEKCGSHYSNV